MMKPRTLIFASGIVLLGFAVGQATQKIWPIFVQGQRCLDPECFWENLRARHIAQYPRVHLPIRQ